MSIKSDQGKLSAQKLLVASSDLRAAASACEWFLNNVKSKAHPLYVPMLTAIIVLYARPFSQNRGYGPLKGKWRKFNDKELQDIHDTLMNMRDKVIAHSDSDVRKVEVQLTDTPLGKMISQVSVVSQSLPMEVFPKVLAACRDLGGRLELEALQEMDHLADGQVLYGGHSL